MIIYDAAANRMLVETTAGLKKNEDIGLALGIVAL